MRPAVRAGARAFMAAYEAVEVCMYCDVKGLVTTGIGNLIDPLQAALELPWIHRVGGARATPAEIVAEWQLVKTHRLWVRNDSVLILTPEAVDELFFRRLDQNEVCLARRWANWGSWPADAQMGAHSCAWAAGAAWRAPHFDIAAGRNDSAGWHICSGTPGTDGNDRSAHGEAWLDDNGNPGLRPRNLANQWLFQNAAVVLADGFDPDQLFYPVQLNG